MKWYYICTIIYAASAIINWIWFVIAYGKNGKYKDEEKSRENDNHVLWVIFCPIYNTWMSLVGWLESPWKPKTKPYRPYDTERSFVSRLIRRK